MTGHYIEPHWLAVAGSGVFYYPASGADLKEPIRVFSDHMDTFHFCDTSYSVLDQLDPVLEFPPARVSYEGPIWSMMERFGRNRDITPGKRIEIHERHGKAPLVIVRRRGFGQMGLAEFAPRSISVFMHRGDGMGEGGSNAWFLSDRPRRYAPLGNLYSKLQMRLHNRALVVTDGSNTHEGFLCRYKSWPPVSGAEAYAAERGKSYVFGRFRWTCVGWLSERYGPTLVWGVTGPGADTDEQLRVALDTS